MSTEWRDRLPEPELQELWENGIRPEVFTGQRPSARPVAVFVGGQPGAGKSRAHRWALGLHPDEQFVTIMGDDFRVHHPDYDRALADTSSEYRMPWVTAQAAGWWVNRSIEHARLHRHSLALETTFRQTDLAIGAAERLSGSGYHVHFVALAVPEVESQLATLDRYYTDRERGAAARWTAPDMHDQAYLGAEHTIAVAEQCRAVTRLTVIERGGTGHGPTLTHEVLFDNERLADGRWRDEPRAHTEFIRRRAEPLTPEQADSWRHLFNDVCRTASKVGVTPEARDAFHQLEQKARKVPGLLPVSGQPKTDVEAGYFSPEVEDPDVDDQPDL